jgi:hypothetical protein
MPGTLQEDAQNTALLIVRRNLDTKVLMERWYISGRLRPCFGGEEEGEVARLDPGSVGRPMLPPGWLYDNRTALGLFRADKRA